MSRRGFVRTSAAAMPIGEAIGASRALARLGERVERSRRMFAAVAPALPANLARSVSAGPLDDDGWSLLCANSAVAAKLRQLVPRLEERLQASGLAAAAIRVKVLPR